MFVRRDDKPPAFQISRCLRASVPPCLRVRDRENCSTEAQFVPATFAAGLVPDDARTPEELVAHADARLLAQKRAGKSRMPILSVRGGM